MCCKEHLSKMKVCLWDKCEKCLNKMKICLWDKLQTVFNQNESVFMGQVANSV